MMWIIITAVYNLLFAYWTKIILTWFHSNNGFGLIRYGNQFQNVLARNTATKRTPTQNKIQKKAWAKSFLPYPFAPQAQRTKMIKQEGTATRRHAPKRIFSPVVRWNGSPELRTDTTAHWAVLARPIRACFPSGRVKTPTRPSKCL